MKINSFQNLTLALGTVLVLAAAAAPRASQAATIASKWKSNAAGVCQKVPSHERCRIHGESNLHAVRDGIRVLKTILREWRGRPAAVVPEPAAATPAADQGAA